MTKDYYKLLEIDRSATQEDIKQAYRSLAQQYHPDKTAHLGVELREAANRKMMELNEAFQALSDPERRQEYDLELIKAEEAQATPYPPPPPPPTGAPGGGPKTDFWRDLERIEAERAEADRAAAERAAQEAAEPEKPKVKPVTDRTVSRNVVEDFAEKFCKAVAQSTGAKWVREEPAGWGWTLESGDWRRSYLIGYCHVENLGTIGLKRVLSRVQTLMDRKKSALKQSHFLFLISYDRIMDRQQVMDSCRAWAAESRKDGQRLLVLLDAAKLSSLLYGVPEEPRMQTVVKFLGARA